jgi:TonB family protein
MVNIEAWKTWQGRTVDGKYTLLEWLGGSDHSAVFLTELREPARKAAIKLVAYSEAEAETQLSRWVRAATLSHPHLLRILATGRAELDSTRFLYVVMEYAEENLAQILPERPLTPAEVTDLLPPVIDVLSYIHGNGLVHGEIKPSNILAAGDQLKLSSDTLRRPFDTLSNPSPSAYQAPEAATSAASPAADIWSLGMTLVAILTQRPPLYDATGPADPIVPTTLPEPFLGIARECLRRDPIQRCTLGNIKARLNPSASQVVAAATLPAVVKPSPQRAGPPWQIIVPVAAIVFVVAVFGFRMIAGDHEPSVRRLPPTPGPPANEVPFKPEPVPVSFPGAVAHQVLPEPPKNASNTITGRILVTVRVDVNSSGKVTDASFRTRGSSPYFANLALQAARQWEFSPPRDDGQAMASVWDLRFQFRRSGIQASAGRVRR